MGFCWIHPAAAVRTRTFHFDFRYGAQSCRSNAKPVAILSPLGLKTRIRNTAPTRNANANAVGRWQQQARQGDSDYRDNDIRTNKTWAAENPEYWKRYREENPAFVERNRNLQQQRNQKQRRTVIANEDVCSGIAVAC